jgi:hypothetical protein
MLFRESRRQTPDARRQAKGERRKAARPTLILTSASAVGSLWKSSAAWLRYRPIVESISILGDVLGPHPSENVAVWIVMALATALLLLLRFAGR